MTPWKSGGSWQRSSETRRRACELHRAHAACAISLLSFCQALCKIVRMLRRIMLRRRFRHRLAECWRSLPPALLPSQSRAGTLALEGCCRARPGKPLQADDFCGPGQEEEPRMRAQIFEDLKLYSRAQTDGLQKGPVMCMSR